MRLHFDHPHHHQHHLIFLHHHHIWDFISIIIFTVWFFINSFTIRIFVLVILTVIIPTAKIYLNLGETFSLHWGKELNDRCKSPIGPNEKGLSKAINSWPAQMKNCAGQIRGARKVPIRTSTNSLSVTNATAVAEANTNWLEGLQKFETVVKFLEGMSLWK